MVTWWPLNVDGSDIFGGFSDVSGLSSEITMAEYRNGNEKKNHVQKVPGMHKVSDVTLKRGVVNSKDLWTWINQVRTQGIAGKRDVVITLLDEAAPRDKMALYPLDGERMLLDYVSQPSGRTMLEVYGHGPGRVLVNGRLIDEWDGVLPRSLFPASRRLQGEQQAEQHRPGRDRLLRCHALRHERERSRICKGRF